MNQTAAEKAAGHSRALSSRTSGKRPPMPLDMKTQERKETAYAPAAQQDADTKTHGREEVTAEPSADAATNMHSHVKEEHADSLATSPSADMAVGGEVMVPEATKEVVGIHGAGAAGETRKPVTVKRGEKCTGGHHQCGFAQGTLERSGMKAGDQAFGKNRGNVSRGGETVYGRDGMHVHANESTTDWET